MIKNIWFDLGGVIISLNNVDEPVSRFKELGFANAGEFMGPFGQKDFMGQVETGEISEEEFIRILGEKCGRSDITYKMAQWAWLGFIGSVHQEYLDFLEELRKDYKVCLMSNTNGFIQKWARSPEFSPKGKPLNDYFDQMFCSHEMGEYKPDVAIFKKALVMSNAKPEETLFIDDSLRNIEGAAKAGIQGLHLKAGMDLIESVKVRLNHQANHSQHS